MKEKIKSFNIIQIISNIFLVVAVICCLTSKNDFFVGIYWFLINISLLGNVWFLSKWTKRGMNLDKAESSKIFNELDNITITFIVVYVLIYLATLLLQNVSLNFRNNIYIIVGFYLFTLLAEYSLYIAEEEAYKKTKKLIKEQIKQKNKK